MNTTVNTSRMMMIQTTTRINAASYRLVSVHSYKHTLLFSNFNPLPRLRLTARLYIRYASDTHTDTSTYNFDPLKNPTQHQSSTSDSESNIKSKMTLESFDFDSHIKNIAALQSHPKKSYTDRIPRFKEKPKSDNAVSLENSLDPAKSIMHYVQTDQMNLAVQFIREAIKTDLFALKHLPSQFWKSILLEICYNKHMLMKNTPVMYRFLISGQVLDAMKELGIYKDFTITKLAILTYAHLGNYDKVLRTYQQAQVYGVNVKDIAFQTVMCRAHILCGEDIAGLKAFYQLSHNDPGPREFEFLLRAYSFTDNEKGLLNALQRMQLSNVKVTDFSIKIIAEFYLRLKKYDIAKKHVEMFIAVEGAMPLELFSTLIAAESGIGNHDVVLKMIDDANKKGISLSYTMHAARIISYAKLGNIPSMWSAYIDNVHVGQVRMRARLAMVKALGSITTPKALNKLTRMEMQHRLTRFRILQDLIRGYSALGDVATVQTFLDRMQHANLRGSDNQSIHLIWANINNNDIKSAVDAIQMIEIKYPNMINFSMWGTILSRAIKMDPKMIEEISECIKKRYPSVSVADEIRSLRMSLKDQHSDMKDSDE
ncbi:hypothetical protein RTP6_006030 [Batrachochytrium dendrobatidis]